MLVDVCQQYLDSLAQTTDTTLYERILEPQQRNGIQGRYSRGTPVHTGVRPG